MRRSTCPFCQGDLGAVGRSRIPMAARRRVIGWPYEASRSRMRYRGACSQGKASVICRAIQSAVGLVVTLIHTRMDDSRGVLPTHKKSSKTRYGAASEETTLLMNEPPTPGISARDRFSRVREQLSATCITSRLAAASFTDPKLHGHRVLMPLGAVPRAHGACQALATCSLCLRRKDT